MPAHPYSFLHFFTLFYTIPVFFQKNMYAHPPVYALPRMLQAEYMKKFLRGIFSVRHRISFNTLRCTLCWISFRTAPADRSGRVSASKNSKNPRKPDVLPDGFLWIPSLKGFLYPSVQVPSRMHGMHTVSWKIVQNMKKSLKGGKQEIKTGNTGEAAPPVCGMPLTWPRVVQCPGVLLRIP